MDRVSISREGLEEVVADARESAHAYVESLFSTLPAVFAAYFSGDPGAAARRLVQLGEQQEAEDRYREARRCWTRRSG